MKVMSFSCVEKLPKLLNHTCGQTIRPAWKTINAGKCNVIINLEWNKDGRLGKCLGQRYDVLKQPRFKIGEKFRVEWKSRNSPKDSWFCSRCGNETYYSPELGSLHKDAVEKNIQHCVLDKFPKILGYGKITQVFKIEMSADGKDISDELAVLDGFSNAQEMLDWFNSHYSLKKIQQFFVYRWDWLK